MKIISERKQLLAIPTIFLTFGALLVWIGFYTDEFSRKVGDFIQIEIAGLGLAISVIGLVWLMAILFGLLVSIDSCVHLRQRILELIGLIVFAIMFYVATLIFCRVNMLEHTWTIYAVIYLVGSLTFVVAILFFLSSAQIGADKMLKQYRLELIPPRNKK